MPYVLPPNGAASTLSGAILVGATTLTIQTADMSMFPGSGTYSLNLHQDALNGPWELCTVTGGQGTAVLTVTRASESFRGTQTARDWPDKTKVVPVLTKAALEAGAAIPTNLHVPGTTTLDGPVSLPIPSGAGGGFNSFVTDQYGDLILQSVFADNSGGGLLGLVGLANGADNPGFQFMAYDSTRNLASIDTANQWAIVMTQAGGLGTPAVLEFRYSGTGGTIRASLDHLGNFTAAAFHATTPPVVTGSRGGNTALASLISALAGLGLLTDSTTV